MDTRQIYSLNNTNPSHIYCYSNEAFSSDEIEPPSLHNNRHSITSSILSLTSIATTSTETANQKKYPSRTRCNVWKNMTMMSLGFFLLSLAFSSLSNIRNFSPIRTELSEITVYVIGASTILSALFFSSCIIQKLGTKWAMAASPILMCCYAIANFFPSCESLIPTAVLLGFAISTMTVAQACYTVEIGKEYAFLVGETAEQIIMQFIGYFYLFVQSGHLASNVIFVLRNVESENLTDIDLNISVCDAMHCSKNLMEIHNVSNISIFQKHIETYSIEKDIFIGCGISVMLILISSALFSLSLDNLAITQRVSPSDCISLRTFRQMKDIKQLLIVPLSIFIGMENAFKTTLLKALLICPFGNWTNSYALICLYFVDAVFSLICPWAIKMFGRLAVFTFAALTNISVTLVIIFWPVEPQKLVVLFVMFGIWGLADAVWIPQVIEHQEQKTHSTVQDRASTGRRQ